MSSSEVHQDRLSLGAGAVFTLREAARLLGWTGAEAWIRRQGIVRRVDGRERVVWGDVLDAVRHERAMADNRPKVPGVAPGAGQSAKNGGSNRPLWESDPAEVLARFTGGDTS